MRMKSLSLVAFLVGVFVILGYSNGLCEEAPKLKVQQKAISADQDKTELLKLICEGNVKGNKCSKCPSYTTDAEAEEEVEVQIIWGNFTTKTAKEAFVITEGCEPHSSNWGGASLYRKGEKGWQKIFYESSHPGKCEMIKNANGLNEFVCYSSWTGQGISTGRLFHLKVESNKTFSTPLGECINYEDSDAPYRGDKELLRVNSNYKLIDINNDGYKDIVVNLTLEQGEFNVKCCTEGGNCECEKVAQRKNYKLEYIYDGKSFNPTQKTGEIESSLHKLLKDKI